MDRTPVSWQCVSSGANRLLRRRSGDKAPFRAGLRGMLAVPGVEDIHDCDRGGHYNEP